MTVSYLDFSIETLTLPHEDPLDHAQLLSEWMTGYPYSIPIERGLIHQAVVALMEKRRLERARAMLRKQKVRTAILDWERAQEDNVARCVVQFSDHPPSSLVALLRSAAGCRWAIQYFERLARELKDDGTWYGEFRIGAIQLQGQSACLDELLASEEAYTTWMTSLILFPLARPVRPGHPAEEGPEGTIRRPPG